MKKIIHIALGFILLFVLAANDGFACGDYSTKVITECSKEDQPKKSCCSDNTSCCDTSSDTKKNCGGDCENSSCHCSFSVSVSVPFTKLTTLVSTSNFTISKRLWNFDPNLPKPVYLAIWSPPKIG